MSIWIIIVLSSVAVAEIITAAMELILKGTVTYDYLLTALVVDLSLTPPVIAAGVMTQARMQRLERLRQEEVAKNRELSASKQRYRTLIEAANDAILVADAESSLLVDCNRQAEALLDQPRAQIIGRPLADLYRNASDISNDTGSRLEKNGLFDYLVGEDVVAKEFELVLEGGKILWVESSSNTFEMEGRRYLHCALRDIGERIRAEKRLRLLANAFDYGSNAILVTDADNRIVEVNPAFTELTGYGLADIQGHDPRLLSSGDTPSEIYRGMWADIARKGYWHGEIGNRRKDGSRFVAILTISVVRDDRGRILYHLANYIDITQRRQAEDQIKYLAHHDALTGLPNRALFEDRLRHALSRLDREETGGLAVFFIDLDNFKSINDTLGHEAGDELLREVSARFQTCLREEDTLARQGGDEFSVLVESCDHYRASLVAERLLRVLSDLIDLGGHEAFITPSIGISMAPEDGRDDQTLLKNADAAMYRVKGGGRNGFQFFSPEMAEQDSKRMRIENGLRHALANGELILRYQPQFDLATGHMVGAEALIRWRQGGNTLSPGEFIPIAEESSLILRIGEWVLDAACAQLAEWRGWGVKPPLVWVNLSGKHIARGTLADELSRLLEQHAIPPQLLGIEITESSLISANVDVLAMLLAVREMGVGISIDDFGTGYSSLSYLKRYPIAELKIDKSFVDGIVNEVDDDAIATAIIQMAHTLGMSVVAEGVENAEQLAVLRAKGCNIAQGYHLGRPMSAAELIAVTAYHPAG